MLIIGHVFAIRSERAPTQTLSVVRPEDRWVHQAIIDMA
jgi:hypothetical protein